MHLSEKGVMKCDPTPTAEKLRTSTWILSRPGHGNALRQATNSKHSYHVNFVASVDPQPGAAALGRRAQDTGARKSKDYVARSTKLVQVVRVEKYCLCKVAEDGPRIEFEELVCRDDGHAVHLARRLVLDHDVEVWNGNRFVFGLEFKKR